MRAFRLTVLTVEWMKKNKTWKTAADIGGVALTVGTAAAGWYVAAAGVLVVWMIVRALLGRPTGGGGIIGVDQQSQGRGKPPRTGSVAGQTVFPPHGGFNGPSGSH